MGRCAIYIDLVRRRTINVTVRHRGQGMVRNFFFFCRKKIELENNPLPLQVLFAKFGLPN